MGIGTPLLEHSYLHLTWRLSVAFLIAAVLATAAAFTIQSWAQRFLAPTQTALLLALEPVFAAITSLVVMGERLNLRSTHGSRVRVGRHCSHGIIALPGTTNHPRGPSSSIAVNSKRLFPSLPRL